jgi:hypothetical protein
MEHLGRGVVALKELKIQASRLVVSCGRCEEKVRWKALIFAANTCGCA